MNILIVNAHSSRNKGDAGIILSMIDSLRKNIPNCNIKIKSRFPEIDTNAYDVSVAPCVANVSIDPKESKFLKLLSAIKLLTLLRGNTINIPESEDYEWADVVVSCGGGFLLSHGFSTALLQHLVQIKVALDYKKPVIIYSQSIGPFYSRFMRKISKLILDKVTKIYIREEISQQWLERIGCQNKEIALVPDSAFCLEMEPSSRVDFLFESIKQQHDGPYIGMTVRDWNFPEVDNKAYYRKKYINSIRAAIQFIEEKYYGKVLLMPQVLGPNPFNDDRIISREILDGLPNTNAELIDYDLHPRELKYFYSKMDMFVGTRMHSNIFSLSSKVPTVAINYEHKTKGIMDLLDLSEFVLDINEITEESIIKTIVKCWDNRYELQTHLTEKIPLVVEAAEIPAKFISSLRSEEKAWVVANKCDHKC
ncbi:MAG: polysaccharide pyruvyl transferase family protein [Anoxybacillus sp.]|nr:polysaccharide pyruvyl transferase family protein [Anoxybacillus sp.]MCL6584921.1 polysaccharide pyruvyl transferase family protein [Anoxybacillus sp.]